MIFLKFDYYMHYKFHVQIYSNKSMRFLFILCYMYLIVHVFYRIVHLSYPIVYHVKNNVASTVRDHSFLFLYNKEVLHT